MYPDYKLGNIGEDSLLDMMNSTEQFEFGASKRDALPEMCQTREVKFACNGECPKVGFY